MDNKIWSKVKVIAPVGFEFGVIGSEASVDDELVLICRKSGDNWPHGLLPKYGINTILEGNTYYSIENE